MKIYVLTAVGRSIAANPTSNVSPAMRILYWLRRHGGQGTDNQITDQLGLSGMDLRLAMNKLTNGSSPAVTELVRR